MRHNLGAFPGEGQRRAPHPEPVEGEPSHDTLTSFIFAVIVMLTIMASGSEVLQ